MGIRTRVQDIVDEFQFQLDMFPSVDYQPLPWVGIHNAKRGEGTKRWEVIEASLDGMRCHLRWILAVTWDISALHWR
jgi:hypothetical protein